MILQNYKIHSIIFTGKQFTFNKYTANEGNNEYSDHKEDEDFMHNSNKSTTYKDLLFFPHSDLHMMCLIYNYLLRICNEKSKN